MNLQRVPHPSSTRYFFKDAFKNIYFFKNFLSDSLKNSSSFFFISTEFLSQTSSAPTSGIFVQKSLQKWYMKFFLEILLKYPQGVFQIFLQKILQESLRYELRDIFKNFTNTTDFVWAFLQKFLHDFSHEFLQKFLKQNILEITFRIPPKTVHVFFLMIRYLKVFYWSILPGIQKMFENFFQQSSKVTSRVFKSCIQVSILKIP